MNGYLNCLTAWIFFTELGNEDRYVGLSNSVENHEDWGGEDLSTQDLHYTLKKYSLLHCQYDGYMHGQLCVHIGKMCLEARFEVAVLFNCSSLFFFWEKVSHFK